MGIFQDILPLPDGQTRLNLKDAARVELFARRFDNFQCVILDPQTMLERNEGNWTLTGGKLQTCLGGCGSMVNFQS